jgi:hypothetical protein
MPAVKAPIPNRSARVRYRPPHRNSASTPDGGQLQLTWPQTHTGWRLEAQTNSLTIGLGANWVTVTGSKETNRMFLPVGLTDGTVFFRLVYP